MSDDLRIPLSALPGFDPVGLFCWDRDQPGNCVMALTGDGWVRFAGDDFPDTSSGSVFLDLADASTRDRLARWVAGRVGMRTRSATRSVAPEWGYNHAWGRWGWHLGGWHDFDGVMFHGVRLRSGWGPRKRIEVPSLAHVRPFDDGEILPDGSRRVDAVALGRVALHLGSQP